MKYGRHIAELLLALLLSQGAWGQVVDRDEAALRADFAHHKVNVLFFFIEDCPACQNMVHHVVALRDSFPEEVLSITGIYVSAETDGTALGGFQEDFALNFPILHDSTASVAASFGATVTPEVLVIDSDGQIRYQGALNNFYYALGRHRRRATAHYLQDAVQAILAGESIGTAYIEPIGCFIDFD